MSLSLAAQLSKLTATSLDAKRLASKSVAATRPSYLFTPTEAASHDLPTIHALGTNGFLELLSVDKAGLEEFEEEFFGEASIKTDRMLLTKDENKAIDDKLDVLLRRLGRFIPTKAYGKTLEWLIRRFRVNDLNVEMLLSTFLPYHQTPQFTRILTVLFIQPHTLHSYLLPVRQAHIPLSRHHLVQALKKDSSLDLLRFVCDILPSSVKDEAIKLDSTLIAFHTGILVGYIEEQKRIDDLKIAVILPAIIESIEHIAQKTPFVSVHTDCLAGNLIVLITLLQRAELTSEAKDTITASLTIASASTPTLNGKKIIDKAIETISGPPAAQAPDAANEIFHTDAMAEAMEVETTGASMTEPAVPEPEPLPTFQAQFASQLSPYWLGHSVSDTSFTADLNEKMDVGYKTYELATSFLTPVETSTTLLKHLFITLRENSLIFLLSIAINHNFSQELQLSALRHAEAFINSYKGGKMDFQTIVPVILVAISASEKVVRSAALACLRAVRDVSEASKDADIYALDNIYGSSSEHIQVLESVDLFKYLDVVLSHSPSLLVDSSHLKSVNQTALAVVKGESKSDTSFKRKVLCYLFSHVVASPSEISQVKILRSLQSIRDRSRVEVLHPLLKTISTATEGNTELSELLLPAFDKTCVVLLQEPQGFWETFVALVSKTGSNAYEKSVRLAALTQLRKYLYASLPANKQVTIVMALVALVASPRTIDTQDIKSCLRGLNISSLTLASVLIQVRPGSVEPARAAKRSKQDSDEAFSAMYSSIQAIVALFEAKSQEKIEGSSELLTVFLETLAIILDCRSKFDINVDYAEQLVLAAACAVSEKMNVIEGGQVDVDVVMKVIRSSQNPQTFHQALLLVSNLARVAPDLVLQNVMPIFISVGANALQKDDAYSFKVVEKTIEGIVPVMISRFKDETQSHIQLWSKCRAFLQIFTGLTPHLPAHRTKRLFTHLVEVLGPKDFLAALCILFLDSATSQKSKKKAIDASVAFALPLSLLEGFSGEVRFEALNDILSETSRILDSIASQTSATAFLETSPDADPAVAAKLNRRRIVLLLSFVQHACAEKSTATALRLDGTAGLLARSLVARLLAITSAASDQVYSEGMGDIITVSQAATDHATRLLSVDAFAEAITPLLTGADQKLQLGAFALLTARMPDISPEARGTISPTVTSALSSAASIIQSAASDADILLVLQAVKAMALSAVPNEHTALSAIVPVLITKGKTTAISEPLVATVFSVLAVINRRLGPRLIPLMKSLVSFAVETIKSGVKGGEKSAEKFRETTLPRVLDSLSGLITSIPTFIAPQLVTILQMTFNPDLLPQVGAVSGPSNLPPAQLALHSLINNIAKSVPAKASFGALFQLWDVLDLANISPIITFLDLLRRVLRNASREALGTQLKPTFLFFMKIFDSRWTYKSTLDEDDMNIIEKKIISAFMEVVVKLNEATFRPLFVRIYDWAVVELADDVTPVNDAHLVGRRLVLFRVMDNLIEKFKSIMTPYTATILDHALELLEAYKNESLKNPSLWSAVVGVLKKSLSNDEGVFWSDAQVKKVLPPLVAQIEILPTLPLEASAELSSALAALATSTSSESILKLLNSSILLHTRSDTASVRRSALQAASAVWAIRGDELLPFVPETVSSFVAECIEDEDAEVESAARDLLTKLEALVGSLSQYLGGE